MIFAPLGTAPNAAIQKYMNTMKVPQLFVATGASRWGPEHFLTIGWQPNYRAECIYATYILVHHLTPKSACSTRTTISGKDYVLGLKDVLGDRYGKMVVSEISYEIAMPMDLLRAHSRTSSSISAHRTGIEAAELDSASDPYRTCLGWRVLSPPVWKNPRHPRAHYQMDVTTRRDPDPMKFRAFMAKYYPEAGQVRERSAHGLQFATALIEVPKRRATISRAIMS